jgi:DNA-nicking Smr family endonuclease
MLWTRLAQSVRPLSGRLRASKTGAVAPTEFEAFPVVVERAAKISAVQQVPKDPIRPVRRPVDFLDHGWERRIAGGQIVPDTVIDLHGHTLDSAHRQLTSALTGATRAGARVLLVITGKPRTTSAAAGERARGAIRAEIGHWIVTSPYADMIASVRSAHPRHGGNGAIYIILRRNK